MIMMMTMKTNELKKDWKKDWIKSQEYTAAFRYVTEGIQKPLRTLKAKAPPAMTPRNSQIRQSTPMSGSIFFQPFIKCAKVTAGLSVGMQYLPLHSKHPKQNPPDRSESIYEYVMLLLNPPQTVNPQVRRSDPVVQKMRILAMIK